MRAGWLFLCLFLVSSSWSAAQTIERNDLNEVFVRAGVQGTFILFTPSANRIITVNGERANKRYIPASTFKIANSLIALETMAVRDENEIIPYGGKRQPFKRWEKDMSMREAIAISNVPIYQEIASRVGVKRYREWLTRLEYGNGEVGREHKDFWLKGPLKISASEQARFLAKLASKRLPLTARSQSIVTDILKLEQSGKTLLYGKTGWTNTPDPDIGWFVGWVSDGKTIHTFALNIDIHNRAHAKLRKPLVRQMLRSLDIFK